MGGQLLPQRPSGQLWVSPSCCWIHTVFPSPETGRGPQPLELSTGWSPGSIHDKLLVVSAVVAAAALCA